MRDWGVVRMLDHATVNQAVIAAVRSFGPPYEGPIESAAVDYAGNDRYHATFNDLRQGMAGGRAFSFDITITPESTFDSVREYVRARLGDHLTKSGG